MVMLYIRFPLSLRNVEDLLLWLPPVVQEVLIGAVKRMCSARSALLADRE